MHELIREIKSVGTSTAGPEIWLMTPPPLWLDGTSLWAMCMQPLQVAMPSSESYPRLPDTAIPNQTGA